MHAVLFSVKRVHHGALRKGRGFLERTQLTPARYDLVQAMATVAACFGQVARRQSDLWKVLGVSRATVSRMLRSMETLGLVRRTVDPRDRRQRWVELTRAGSASFRLARRLVQGPAAALVERLFPPCGYRWTPPPDEPLVPEEDIVPPLARVLGRARRRLRDRATLLLDLLPRPPLEVRPSTPGPGFAGVPPARLHCPLSSPSKGRENQGP